MKKSIVYLLFTGIIFASCTTTRYLEEPNNFRQESAASSIEEEEHLNESEEKNYLIQEELKIQDIEPTVVYIEKPVYIPDQTENRETDITKLKGHDAVTDSLKKAVKTPENYKNGTFFYQYDENLVYEIYAQPYQLTDIVLEPGEVVIGTPLLSEDESVWELTAGVAREPQTGKDIQHLFIKPAYSKLDSSLVIITDKRVYHFRLISFSDTHMAMVKFTYPLSKNVWAKKQTDENGRTIENNYVYITNPDLLSFDYSIRYSVFRKPDFLPERVYDDGQYTYIHVNKQVMQKKLPVLFNEKNEIINYSVHDNVFVIPRLIDRLTLRLGKEKVEIHKKITKESKVREGKSDE